MAESEGFEPPEPVKAQQFSRLSHSTALATLLKLMAVPFVARVKRERRMAGSVGFEPTHDGIKTRCLTTWLRPNALLNYKFQTIPACRQAGISNKF